MDTTKTAERVTEERPKTVVEEVEKLRCPECEQQYKESEMRTVWVTEDVGVAKTYTDHETEPVGFAEMCMGCADSRVGVSEDMEKWRSLRFTFDDYGDWNNPVYWGA